ncbi:hypothetical protein OPIT5_27350 [Opitutaceae bacterium TAV5]|nr:hypothetical protein OPIT5_27350 [Opitutaceae bacterium TAV5]
MSTDTPSPLAPAGSLRRILDLMLRKQAYLSQFRQLGDGPASPADLGYVRGELRNTMTGKLVIALLQEGFAETSGSDRNPLLTRYRLTKRGRRLLTLLGDLEWLDIIAGAPVPSDPKRRLVRAAFGGRVSASARMIRRLLRVRGAPVFLARMPVSASFTTEDMRRLIPGMSPAGVNAMLRLFVKQGLLSRSRFTQFSRSRYELTEPGLEMQAFFTRLGQLDGRENVEEMPDTDESDWQGAGAEGFAS